MGVIAVASVTMILSFALGSIPSAYIAARIAGKGDIRTLGSGNSGATNAYRSLGMRWAVPVFAFDFIKGASPVLVSLLAAPIGGIGAQRLAAFTGCAAVFGHIFSPWIGFRGGKGAATGAGACTALMPTVAPICLAVFLVVLRLSRRMSVASLSAAAALPVAVFALARLGGELPDVTVVYMAAIVPAAVFLAHAKNIARLFRGTEPRLF